jgi:DNA sulfur modification protein DndC
MEAMIDSGEEWLEPLLEFRDLLSETQDPEKKRLYREFRRRSGQVNFIRESDTPVPGPYTLDFCRYLLQRLIETQSRVQKEAPVGEAPILIHDAELHEIRRLWRTERGDWADSVPAIVRQALGRDLDWVLEDATGFTSDDRQLLEQVCQAHNVPTELLVQLIDAERDSHGLKRRHGIHTRIEELFRQEWRDLDSVVAARRAARDDGSGFEAAPEEDVPLLLLHSEGFLT